MSEKALPAINIQFPISELILSGKKIIETRTYPLPEKYIEKDLYLVETPGANGKFKARVVAIVRFGRSFQYKNKAAFYRDVQQHHVDRNSKWSWKEKAKWGWPIIKVTKLKGPARPADRTGIIFTAKLHLKK